MAVAVAKPDYSLVGDNTIRALQKGLAEATWYTSPVPKEKMRELLERRDWPALRDSLLWFALLIGTGLSGYLLWTAGSGPGQIKVPPRIRNVATLHKSCLLPELGLRRSSAT